MIDFNGLWKDSRCGLLVQLHGANVRTYKRQTLDEMVILKAVARLITGEESQLYEQVCLVAVLPKKPYEIRFVAVGKRGPTMWDVEGLVVRYNE